MDKILGIDLSDLPVTVKLLFSATLLTMGVGYLFALTNVGLAIGFTPVKIIEHYWGNPATREALDSEADPASVVEEEFSFDQFEEEQEAAGPIVAIPSFESLVAEGHFHLLSYAMIFFICGFIVSFADMTAGWKNAIILAPFAASVLDIWSTLLTRFVGPSFAWMLMVSGFVMAISFAAVFGISMHQMWFSKNRGDAAE